jgi:hypothetical protein
MHDRCCVNQNGSLFSVTMQELLECQYVNGCAGGASQDAYTFAAANGLESEEDYPYTCLPGGNCPSKHKCSRTVPGGAGPAPAIQIDGVRLRKPSFSQSYLRVSRACLGSWIVFQSNT